MTFNDIRDMVEIPEANRFQGVWALLSFRFDYVEKSVELDRGFNVIISNGDTTLSSSTFQGPRIPYLDEANSRHYFGGKSHNGNVNQYF